MIFFKNKNKNEKKNAQNVEKKEFKSGERKTIFKSIDVRDVDIDLKVIKGSLRNG